MAGVEVGIDGVRLVGMKAFGDARGSFHEAFRASWFGGGQRWVQWNVSRSTAGVLRGLHYHRKQTDYWHVVEGRILVGLVDARAGSPTFRRATCLELSSAEPQGLFIPPGVLHGFRAITSCVLMYLLDQEYDNSDENGVRWDDREMGLPEQWYAGPAPVLSGRDAGAPSFKEVLANEARIGK